MASTSKETKSTEMTEGRFSEEHFTPILRSDNNNNNNNLLPSHLTTFTVISIRTEMFRQAINVVQIFRVIFN